LAFFRAALYTTQLSTRARTNFSQNTSYIATGSLAEIPAKMKKLLAGNRSHRGEMEACGEGGKGGGIGFKATWIWPSLEIQWRASSGFVIFLLLLLLLRLLLLQLSLFSTHFMAGMRKYCKINFNRLLIER